MVSIRNRVSSEHVRDGVIKGRFDNYDIEGIVKKLEIWDFTLVQIIFLVYQTIRSTQ